MFVIKYITISLVMFSIACTPYPKNIQFDNNYIFDSSSKKGLVIGSLTQSPYRDDYKNIITKVNIYNNDESIKKTLTTSRLVNAELNLVKTILVGIAVKIATFGLYAGQDQYKYPDGHFTDEYGYVFAMELDVGDYYIKNIDISFPTKLSSIFSSRKFTVREGEIIYIGNMHINLDEFKRKIFGHNVETVYPVFRNKRNRDIEHFIKSYPKFNNAEIQDQLPS